MFQALAAAARAGIPSLAAMLRYSSLIEVPVEFEQASFGLDIASDLRLPWKSVAVETTVLAEGTVVPMAVVVERIGTVASIAWQNYPLTGPVPHAALVFGGMDRNRRSGTSDCGIEDGDCFRWASTVRLPARDQNVDVTFWCPRVAVQGGGDSARMLIDMTQCQMAEHYAGRPPVVRFPTNTEARDSRGDFWRAIRLATLVSQPSNWIVKRVPGRAERRNAERSTGEAVRDRWLLITNKERERWFRESARELDAGDGNRREIASHPRRAHYRHIGQNDDGTRKYTWVRACWVGSTEAEIRGQRYRVELEL